MPTGIQTLMMAQRGASFSPELIPNAAFYIDTSRSVITRANVISGTAAGLTKTDATVMTLSSGTGLVASYNGGTLILSGYPTAANNGKFTILTAGTGTCTYLNPAGVSESGGGSAAWTVEGQCVGITELVSGLTLTQPGAITAQMSICTSDNAAGKPIVGQAVTGTRWVSLDNTTVAGKMNGPGPFSFFWYLKPLTFSGAAFDPLQYRDVSLGTTPVSIATIKGYVASNNGRSFYLATTLATATTHNMPAGLTMVAGTWYSVAGRYDGNTSTDWYLNGAFFGTGTGTPARTVTGQRTVTFGACGGGNSANPGSCGGVKIAGMGVWKGDIGATKIAELDAYFRSWQP